MSSVHCAEVRIPSGDSTNTVDVGAPGRVLAADHVDLAGDVDRRRVAARRGQRRSGGPRVEVPGAGRRARRRRRPWRVVPSDPPMYRSCVPTWTIDPSVRGAGRVSSGGDGSQGTIAPSGAGHGSDLVLGRAEVDRRPDHDAEVDRPGDREVVGAVGDVAEHDDDDDQPDGGLDGRPPPAVRVEQAEQGPSSRYRGAGCERLLRHRPPILTRPTIRSAVDHCAVSVPVMFGVHRAEERVRPGRERRDVVRLLGDARERLALVDDRPGPVLDRDVMRHAGVLVVEVDRERLVRPATVRASVVELDPRGGQVHRRRAGGHRCRRLRHRAGRPGRRRRRGLVELVGPARRVRGAAGGRLVVEVDPAL